MLPPLIEEKLRQYARRCAELEREIADPETIARTSRYRALTRERASLSKIVQRYEAYQRTLEELRENEALSHSSREDAELRQLAREEVARLKPRVEALADELTGLVLDEDTVAGRKVILEIRAGIGGEEAALFAGDLFRMYSRFAERRGWTVEILGAHPTDLGGFREIIFGLSGDSVYRDLCYEMGGHRVQRVPQTEAGGRIHTSAATVAVMSEPEEVEVEIKESDLRIDFYRAGGPGGQNVNKVSSAVRITHLPTGIVVAIQDESSQHKNRAKAMRVLRTRLHDLQEQERREKERDLRRSQIGSGDRNQRIRTYNFPQNRVTDHRIGRNFNLDRIIDGDLDDLVTALRGYDREEKMKVL